MSNKKPVAELEGDELDYWVAKAEGKRVTYFNEWFMFNNRTHSENNAKAMLDRHELKDKWCVLLGMGVPFKIPNYSTDWAEGGPLFDKYDVTFDRYFFKGEKESKIGAKAMNLLPPSLGETRLIAGCRAIVALKYLDYVDAGVM
jgi:hypothetical protein